MTIIIGLVVSEIIRITKIDTDGGGTDGLTDRQMETGTYFREKHESGQLPDGHDYNTSLAYAREVKRVQTVLIPPKNLILNCR